MAWTCESVEVDADLVNVRWFHVIAVTTAHSVTFP